MRLIDADEIMKALSIFNDSKNGNMHFLYGIRTAKELIDDAPTVGGWISVKDRLPEEGVRVLAVKKLKDGRRDLALATCIPEYKHHDYVTGEDIVEPYWVCGGNNNITHWMPLPEMPEEESHGNTET